MSTLNTLVTEYEAAKTALTTKIKDALQPAFTAFFEANPEFRSVEWTQYTPYFNDGDPCEFGVGDFRYSAQPELYADEDFAEQVRDGDYCPYELEENEIFYSPASLVAGYDEMSDEQQARIGSLDRIFEQFRTQLDKIPAEVLEDAFGDHKHIKVTREGVEIKTYSHD